MSQLPPDRYGMSDEQSIEVEQATSDLGFNHQIVEDDPAHRDTLDERLRREAPERHRARHDEGRLVAPGSEELQESYVTDVDVHDLSAEERAVHIHRVK
ncbi:hypothetical protein HS041_23385 [Planomonospora sp. ID67723]|uniref:hypothetical protein n=1 Tax=Planomonospora sp. ID67723 TaxID=2738134 RepID=UPI0018C43C2C|nr:hypothetical protein [Planomonospora sp. ID67723]MBG0830708.1 hypothetical protein [Planomonospora sp. ID67723]